MTLRSIICLLLIPCALVAGPARVSAVDLSSATVVEVYEADFVRVRHPNGEEETLWILGFTPPGTRHPKMPDGIYKEDAAKRARQLLLDKEVYFRFYKAIDPDDSYYKRRMRRAHLFLPDRRSYAVLMVKEGYGWARFSGPMTKDMRDQLMAAHKDAKSAKRGVWEHTADEWLQITPGDRAIVSTFYYTYLIGGIILGLTACVAASYYSGTIICF